MSAHNTAEETRKSFEDNMGVDLGSVFYLLWSEVEEIYAKWGEFTELYVNKSMRVDLLNHAAGFFFRIVQDVLWENVLLHLSRLTDPERTGKKENLTICILPPLINDEDLKRSVYDSVEEVKDKSKFARDWRNRRIAHSDLHLLQGINVESLSLVSISNVNEVLSLLANVLNLISLLYQKAKTYFGDMDYPGNAVDLLYVLDDGIRAKEEQKNRIRSGKYRKEDFLKKKF